MSEELAYLAGFLDGEGSIGMTRATRHQPSEFTYIVQVNVFNTNPVVLRRFLDRFGGSISRIESRKPQWKPSYTWSIASRKAVPVLVALRPYLVLKRKQAELALEAADIISGRMGHGQHGPGPLPARLLEIDTRLRELNRKGPSPQPLQPVLRRPVYVHSHRRRR